MRSIIKIALFLIVGVLVYNYFWGTESEKATSEKVFRQVKEVGRSIGDLIKQEKEKFADGKYDRAFENLGKVYEDLKDKVSDSSSNEDRKQLEVLQEQKETLEQKKEALQRDLQQADPDEDVIERGASFDEELKQLVDETTRLLDKVMRRDKDKPVVEH